MSFFSGIKKFAILAGLPAIIMTPAIGHAGFEWTPPPAKQVAPETQTTNHTTIAGPLTPEPDAISAAPAAPIESVDALPVPTVAAPGMKTIKAEEKPVAAPMPVTPSPVATPVTPPVATSAATPVAAPAAEGETLYARRPATAPEPILPAAVAAEKAAQKVTPSEPAAAVPAMPQPDNSAIEGFGKDIPLALALRDIVPPSYAYSFGNGELAGRKISWRGGKPWKDVLDKALEPLGATATVQGNVVMISLAETAATATPMPAAAPAAIPMPAPEPQTAAIAAPTTPTTGMARPVVDLTVKKTWEARPGSTLRQVLESWGKTANVDVSWSTAYDYPVNNAFYFEGTYGEAVDSLLSSYGGESPAPKGRLYPNLPDGPSVLMITN